MILWPEVKKKKIYLDFCDGKQDISFRLNLYDKLFAGEIDTWDYQWGFAKMINSGLSIISNVNMISNIGFGKDATHIKNGSSKYACMKTLNLPAPYLHPKVICQDRISDSRYLNNFLYPSLLNRFVNNLNIIGRR